MKILTMEKQEIYKIANELIALEKIIQDPTSTKSVLEKTEHKIMSIIDKLSKEQNFVEFIMQIDEIVQSALLTK